MIYSSVQAWRDAPRRKVMLFGMSGLGKTHVSNMLRGSGDWFHYSVDYRIGTRYMGEHIVDNAKREAMKVPFLRDLLMSDSIYIGSNITFNNLAPLSSYLGKPGSLDLGGLDFSEYMRRQDQHQIAESAALLDTKHFIVRARELYGYNNFVCDTGGSICEIVNPSDPQDPILKSLFENTLIVWIKGSDVHTSELVRRFDQAPKPMFYKPEFLVTLWSDYMTQNRVEEKNIDPDAFVRWAYSRALARRQPLYKAMSKWGISVAAADISQLQSNQDFIDLIADGIQARSASI